MVGVNQPLSKQVQRFYPKKAQTIAKVSYLKETLDVYDCQVRPKAKSKAIKYNEKI